MRVSAMGIKMQNVLDYLGLSGVLALFAGAVGYGALHQRVDTLEKRDRGAENSIAIARLEEQCKAIRSDISDIKHAVVKS